MDEADINRRILLVADIIEFIVAAPTHQPAFYWRKSIIALRWLRHLDSLLLSELLIIICRRLSLSVVSCLLLLFLLEAMPGCGSDLSIYITI